jgi:microcystin-dependent protein
MSAPFVAEIRIFPFNFAPKGWAFCSGQLLPISQNTALFSLLGTQYGGDGKSTFALPDLSGSVAIHTDQYSGGGNYPIGSPGGVDNVNLLTSEMPAHTHNLGSDNVLGDSTLFSPTNNVPGNPSPNLYYKDSSTQQSNTTMNPSMVTVMGSGYPHNNLQPYVTLNYCIAMQGIFPARP